MTVTSGKKDMNQIFSMFDLKVVVLDDASKVEKLKFERCVMMDEQRDEGDTEMRVCVFAALFSQQLRHMTFIKRKSATFFRRFQTEHVNV